MDSNQSPTSLPTKCHWQIFCAPDIDEIDGSIYDGFKGSEIVIKARDAPGNVAETEQIFLAKY